MNLRVETLPASGGRRQSLALLHGWGSDIGVWRPLLAQLRCWADVTLVDLPGLAPGLDAVAFDTLLDALERQLPSGTVLLGWSLGGQIAAALAARQPDRYPALITLCSNPRYVADGDWPGMATAELAAFRDQFADRPVPAQRRFDTLQAGADTPRALLRQLQGSRAAAAGRHQLAGLDWLAQLDLRPALASLATPQLHLLAGADALLPVAALEPALAALLAGRAHIELGVLPGAGHLAPLQAAAAINLRVQAFLDRQGLLEAAPDAVNSLDKSAVAASFSRAAAGYDASAQLQREVGEHLLTMLPTTLPETPTVLDLGSGTGHFAPALQARLPGACYLGLDLAEGMVRHARGCHGGEWLVADAEALPLRSGSVGLVFSSLAVQWCQNPRLLFAELGRVLAPGGRVVFSTLGPGTLNELRGAWAAVDGGRHVNDFIPAAQLAAACEGLPGLQLQLETRQITLRYREVRELLADLKGIGAHNSHRDRPAGLTGRRALAGMLRAYEGWREDGWLPASYEVYYGALVKT